MEGPRGAPLFLMGLPVGGAPHTASSQLHRGADHARRRAERVPNAAAGEWHGRKGRTGARTRTRGGVPPDEPPHDREGFDDHRFRGLVPDPPGPETGHFGTHLRTKKCHGPLCERSQLEVAAESSDAHRSTARLGDRSRRGRRASPADGKRCGDGPRAPRPEERGLQTWPHIDPYPFSLSGGAPRNTSEGRIAATGPASGGARRSHGDVPSV